MRLNYFIISLALEVALFISLIYWLIMFDRAIHSCEKLTYAMVAGLILGGLVINTFTLIDTLREE